ncbi:DUF342 domain-containing protein [Acetivibrio clariflavus]|uniref:Putative polymerase with PALM domain, HD hydrolase domain and Zn ribbon n=1 Tax=Acetivibrio clariflavus (strain DSM 19732 / NBRC 101661 / EBR45) TaxID=720554 RepID=G8LSQ6_ACECE|nr:FapA family protein [Acetivibrio clariflavus]AEV69408.1 putative polymerase with PALM domain, HD hydrolase domain and Zn ribbon [Acetivibrio clariflavus DSM 19732]
MNDKILYSDEYITIYLIMDGLYLESFKKGMPISHLNDIINSHPEFKITDFNAIKNAINNAPQPPKKFGVLKEKIAIKISEDKLKATVTYYAPKDYFDIKNRENLMRETYEALKKNDITFGIKRDFFLGNIEAGKTYVIAEGEPSIDGEDSIVKMYQLKEVKPEIKEDGKTNYYELKLINTVKAGDWLGERIEAKEGSPGRTVTGEIIEPRKGKQYPLLYDKNTVYEVFLNDRTVLYSKINGAVNYVEGRITVANHLEIDGDVDFNTGNIKFDGFVSINGTVTDGFSVEATKDIEINSPLGIGNVKTIRSLQGSIFIKGGIVSKNHSVIDAKKDIYTKFADNAFLRCGGLVHIGFYCINSTVEAKEVYIESPKGNIIGGYTKAEAKVTSAIIGSPLEVKTVVEVSGFDRDSFLKKLEEIKENLEDMKNERQSLKKELSGASHQELSPNDIKMYNQLFNRLAEIQDKIKALEYEQKNISRYLKTKGNGEIAVTKKIYPNCTLIINKNQVDITHPTIATSFYCINGELKQT